MVILSPFLIRQNRRNTSYIQQGNLKTKSYSSIKLYLVIKSSAKLIKNEPRRYDLWRKKLIWIRLGRAEMLPVDTMIWVHRNFGRCGEKFCLNEALQRENAQGYNSWFLFYWFYILKFFLLKKFYNKGITFSAYFFRRIN